MNLTKSKSRDHVALWFVLLIPILFLAVQPQVKAQQSSGPANRLETNSLNSVCASAVVGSPYIPVDSWIYPAVARLYAMGYASDVYLGLRPWTRTSVSHMLEISSAEIQDADMYGDSTVGEAQDLYAALARELKLVPQDRCPIENVHVDLESSYSAVRAISGTPLRDSFHLGSTIVNDYGRPYANGVNNYSGASGYASADRFVLYLRGEFQVSPSYTGYSPALAATLAGIDVTNFYYTPACWSNGGPSCTPLPLNQQPAIPAGPIKLAARGRLLEAYVSAQYFNHVISFGKQDYWQGPAEGGAMSYSNNAENIYSFRINRIEPLRIPLLSTLTGPFRYEFMIGPLKGHTYPIDPWVHIEKISFRPSQNVEIGFERTVIWGGKGHGAINLKSFLRGFFSVASPAPEIKNSPQDPGARFAAFDFSYRLPFLRNWVTLYSDSEVHDDVSTVDAPRHAAFRPGAYLSHVPGIPKLDLRVEAVSTDPASARIKAGTFMYWEEMQRNGYTNSGQIFGDWIGREAKGGQGWATFHLSGNEWIRAGLRTQKVENDFIPGGTTLNDINFQVVKRLGHDLELKGDFAFEHYKAPIYLPGQQTVTATTFQLTWFPERKVSF